MSRGLSPPSECTLPGAPTVDPARRRGIAGTVLVHKIAGAAAAGRASLGEIARVAREAADDLGSMGVALGACTIPGAAKPNFELDAMEIELGLGIHGEPGVQKAVMERAELLVERLLSVIIEDKGFAAGTRLALLVNGLGATPPMELAIVARDALRYLRERGFVVERAWSGTLLSGDGDLGFSMARGAAAIAALPAEAWATPEIALSSIAHALRRAIGGSSGPFYATAVLRASRTLAGKKNPAPAEWADAFTQAVSAISDLGGAKIGDRTMVDALQPAAEAFATGLRAGQSVAQSWAAATEAGRKGCDATAAMVPRLGRASYLGTRAMGIPDAGATAVTVWLYALIPHVG
ncbi:MAG: dihydroxyacetone kinase subunit DhaK [Burkholderiales bacterium]